MFTSMGQLDDTIRAGAERSEGANGFLRGHLHLFMLLHPLNVVIGHYGIKSRGWTAVLSSPLCLFLKLQSAQEARRPCCKHLHGHV